MPSVQEYMGALHHLRLPTHPFPGHLMQVLQHGRSSRHVERLYLGYSALPLVLIDVDSVLMRNTDVCHKLLTIRALLLVDSDAPF